MSSTKIEWDETAASKEDAPAGTKLLNAVVPLHNQLVDVVAKYKAAEDIDSAVEEAATNSTDEEIVKWKEEVAKAEKLIAARSAAIDEKVRKALVAEIDPEFDKAKVVAQYNDLRSQIKKDGTNIRDMFKLLQFVSSETSPAGRESNFKGVTKDGEILLAVLDIPKLENEKGNPTGASDAVKEFNRAAKQWAKDNGVKVADKGALSTEVKEGYSKATNTPIPA